ncbi:MAG: SGNH/GDSL hydrolase family protein [Bacteroidota bacterium]|nr:SGNH/GDSL hydrolase family protein [Bacteroidota bacterium]
MIKYLIYLNVIWLFCSCATPTQEPQKEVIGSNHSIVGITSTSGISVKSDSTNGTNKILDNYDFLISSSSIDDTNRNSIAKSYNFTVNPVLTTLGNSIKTIKILALGDSYTIGQSVSVSERYPVQLADTLKKLGYNVPVTKIIATTGWTTGELLNGISNANDTSTYDLVFLLIGVNNQYRGNSIVTYRSEFITCLNTAINFAKGNKNHVIVISIPDYGYTPFGRNNQMTISAGINNFNAVNLQESNNVGVNYVNITDISRNWDPLLVANDGLHPSGYQYKLWVNRITPVVDSIFSK